MRVQVKVEGLRELETALKQLPNATAKNVLRRVLRARAEPVADAARRLVKKRTGQLEESIDVSTTLSRRQKTLHQKGGKSDVEVFVGAGALPQAHMEEFGGAHNDPHPFMRPAWDAEKQGVLDGLKADLWAEIEKAAARLARKAARAARKG